MGLIVEQNIPRPTENSVIVVIVINACVLNT